MRLPKLGRWIILAASVPLVAIALYLALRPGPQDAPNGRYVSFAFTGLTNDNAGHALPVFSF